MPETMPVALPIVAIPGAEEDHVPPDVAFASVVDWPSHMLVTPVIPVGAVVTVTVLVALQPLIE